LAITSDNLASCYLLLLLYYRYQMNSRRQHTVENGECKAESH